MAAVFLRDLGVRLAAASALLAALSGCGLLGESATKAVVAPGKYNLYTCDQLARTARTVGERERELSELMARAAREPVGKFVGQMSYGTELMQARGQLKQIAQLSAEKNCAVQSKWLSDRALW